MSSPSSITEPRVLWPELEPESGASRAPVVVEVQGVERVESLRVYVDVPSSVPPVSGQVQVLKRGIGFQPRYPWRRGLAYKLDVETSERLFTYRHRFPDEELAKSTQVQAIYPSAQLLPANLLRFYVHFTAPMSLGEVRKRVSVMDDRGEVLEDVFLGIEPELWDPDRRRLTLLFDPGRIKRGLRPNEELGSPLEPDRAYHLVIAAGFEDARGVPLVEGHRHSFRTVAADRTQPSTSSWNIEPPAAGTRAAWRIRFPEPLDHALLQRMIRIHDSDGARVVGASTVSAGETSWSFVPRDPWREGVHELLIDPGLEDLAGNNLARSFEVVLEAASVAPVPKEPIRRTYDLRPEN